MPLTPERQHLNEVLEARMLKLRLTWVEVARRGEISVESIHAIRRGTVKDIRTRTQDALERALEMPSGEIKRILEGDTSYLGTAEVVDRVTDEDRERLEAELEAQGVRLDLLTEADLHRLVAYAKGLADGRATPGNGDDTNRRVS